MRWRQLKARDVVRVLTTLGFMLVRQKGSHAFYQHPITGRSTVVPIHSGEDIGRGLLRAILREAEITTKEFEENL